MFNIGFTELVILGVIGLLVIGPEQLPDMARKVAKLLNELKRAKDEIMEPVDELKSQAFQAVERARRQVDDQVDKINHAVVKPGQQNLIDEEQKAKAEADKKLNS